MRRTALVLLVLWPGVPGAAQEPGTSDLTVPSGTILQIRLKNTISSYSTKRDSPIAAEVISPVELNGQVILPMHTLLSGRVRDVRKVGLGFSRDTALLDLEFNSIRMPGRQPLELTGKVVRVNDAREKVDDQGRIRGIRATDTFSTLLAGIAIGVSVFDPMALAFALSASLSIFRIPDASVILPAGAELQFKVESSIPVGSPYPSQYPQLAVPEEAQTTLASLVRAMPYRTATKGAETPSDITSLLYLGSKEAIENAFRAAGWVRSDELNAQTAYGAMRSIIENQGYSAAPMSVLRLDGRDPELAYAKTLNTFFSRHHLRIYAQDQTFRGKLVWTSTATYDSGIAFSRASKSFIHLINEHIDEERSKVVNDLVLTGCVDGVEYLDRPWVPRDARNATGDALLTDGRIAVVELNNCADPVRADAEAGEEGSIKTKQSPFLKPISSTLLTLRHDFTRGNVIYQGYQGTRMGLDVLRKPPADSDRPRSIQFGGQEFLVVEGVAPAKHPEIPKDAGHEIVLKTKERGPRSYVNRLMFSMSGGLAGYGSPSFSTLPLAFVISTPAGPVRDSFGFDNSLYRGWTLSPKVTLNSWKYISSEFAYTRTTTNFRVYGAEPLANIQFDVRAKAGISQFTYNALIHFLPNGKRIRPYIAVGPAFQLIHLLEAQAQRHSWLRLAARDVAIFLTAYDFGTKPPLEGGGVFQVGLNYGGGVRFHLSPRLFLRADFRETLSKMPDFWGSTARTLEAEVSTDSLRLETAPLVRHGPLRQQQITAGIGISF